MKIAVDTNILVRVAVRDDETQAQAAMKVLANAEIIAVPLPCLCEFAWVLRAVYGFKPDAVATAIGSLLAADKIVVNRQAVETGLMHLQSGGDFADGVIVFEGRWLGGETFVSFDQQAVARATRHGQQALLLG